MKAGTKIQMKRSYEKKREKFWDESIILRSVINISSIKLIKREQLQRCSSAIYCQCETLWCFLTTTTFFPFRQIIGGHCHIQSQAVSVLLVGKHLTFHLLRHNEAQLIDWTHDLLPLPSKAPLKDCFYFCKLFSSRKRLAPTFLVMTIFPTSSLSVKSSRTREPPKEDAQLPSCFIKSTSRPLIVVGMIGSPVEVSGASLIISFFIPFLEKLWLMSIGLELNPHVSLQIKELLVTAWLFGIWELLP